MPNALPIIRKLLPLIAKQLRVPASDITSEASFIHDLNISSLDALELAMAIEETFGVRIQHDDVEKLTHVRDVISYIESRTRGRSAT
jgi:acyl carrier protein